MIYCMQEDSRHGEPQCMKEVESRVPSKGPARFGGGRTHAPQRCDGVPYRLHGFSAYQAEQVSTIS
jgi:hypothetical protein